MREFVLGLVGKLKMHATNHGWKTHTQTMKGGIFKLVVRTSSIGSPPIDAHHWVII